MAYEGWLYLAGNEVINNSRAYAAAATMGLGLQCDPCPDFANALGESPYLGVDDPDNPAPWYDPSRPESIRFAGVIGLGVQGLGRSTLTHNPTQLIAGGSLVGPTYARQREITYRVMLLASDDCGLAYGRAWLAGVLRGSACGNGCAGDTACILACCPVGQPPSMWENPAIRTLYNVGLLEQDEPEGYARLSGTSDCTGAAITGPGVKEELTFTLVSGQPYVFRNPINAAIGVSPTSTIRTNWTWDLPAYCATAPDCSVDPRCPPPGLPAQPPVPADPCLPEGDYTARAAMVGIPSGLVSPFDQVVPLIYVDNGARDIRKFQVRFYTNLQGNTCSFSNFDRCQACTAFGIGYLPRNSTLVIDGRVQRSWLECAPVEGRLDNRVESFPSVYGPGGEASRFPVFDCGSGMCISVMAEAETNINPDWSVTVQLVARQDAT